MIRKYWWLVVFLCLRFLFDTFTEVQWIELLATETDAKCLQYELS